MEEKDLVKQTAFEEQLFNEKLSEKAALRMEAADGEAAQKEKEYQDEQKVWWKRLFKKIRSPQGDNLTRRDVLVGVEREVTDKRKWKFLVAGINELNKLIKEGESIIFSGGACNYIDDNGDLQRNEGRDLINEKLNQLKQYFFDPQIDMYSHDREYDYDQDGPAEKKAITESKHDIYEVNDKSLGGITMLEIIRDRQNKDSERIVFFNSEDGLNFNPRGLDNHDPVGKEKAKLAHKEAFIKAMNSMRKEVVAMLTQDGLVKSDDNLDGNVRIVYEDDGEFKIDVNSAAHLIKITDKESHLTDLLEVYCLAMQKKEVVIIFSGNHQDERGRLAVDEENVDSDLDKYIAEGNKMREMLEKYMEQDNSSRAVYSQEEVIKIIEEELS